MPRKKPSNTVGAFKKQLSDIGVQPPPPKKKRLVRTAKVRSSYGFCAQDRDRLRSRHNTRGRQALSEMIENNEYYIQPAAPDFMFRGTRPSWLDADGIWNRWGGKGVVQCVKAACTNIADSIDHIVDWTTYVIGQCDTHQEECDGGVWEGFSHREVVIAYNDFQNLQPLCQSCNSKKSGPKNLDRLRPEFTRRR